MKMLLASSPPSFPAWVTISSIGYILIFHLRRNSIHVANFFCRSFHNCNWNFFFLWRFPDAPVCITDKIVIVGAYRSENLNVACEVHADPPPRSFRWKFNSSGESFELPKDQHYKNGSYSSVLRYKPTLDQDYGTLTCAGINEVGEQATPCVFQVVLAGEVTKTTVMTFNFLNAHLNVFVATPWHRWDKQENFSDMKTFPWKSH